MIIEVSLCTIPGASAAVGGNGMSPPGAVQQDEAGGVPAYQNDNYRDLYHQGKLLFEEQKYQESLKVLDRCLALNQQDPELYKLVASDAILINRMDIAEQALNSARRLAPSDSLVLFNLGALYYTDSRFAQAQPVLEESVKLNPDFVPARLFLGLTLEELNQEPGAIDAYRKSIEIGERTQFKGEQPYLYLGRLLYRENKLSESLPYLQKAAQANPQSCESLCLISRVESTQGREDPAVAALQQCIQADPKYSEAHYLLSRAYAKQGRTEDAAREMATFQDLKKREQNKKDPRRNQRAIQ
jgi:tetratricopeptide (TPR) repeat protein